VLGVPLTIVQGSFLGVFGLSEPGLAHLCAVPLHGVLSEHKALGAASPLATNPFALLMAGEAASSLCGRTGEVRQYRKVDSSSLCSVEQFSGRSQPQAVGKAAWPSAPFQSPPHHRASWTVLRGEALLSDKGLCPFCTVQPRMECAGSYSKIGPPSPASALSNKSAQSPPVGSSNRPHPKPASCFAQHLPHPERAWQYS
jgi:hypothetical protein